MNKKIILINKLVFVLSIVFLFISSINAQEEYLYENISVSEGLSSARFNIKSTIYQDRFGFMWFGTVDGLNRYDGYSFKVYKNLPGDSTSLPSSDIQAIGEDSDKNLWIGTNGVVSILDRKTNTFENIPIEQYPNRSKNSDVFSFMVDSKNNFWISTAGSSIQKWNKVDRKFEAIPFMLNIKGVDTLVERKNSVVIGMAQLRNGNILAASFSLGIYFYNESENIFEEYKISGYDQPIGIVSIMEDRSGNIWFSGKNTLAIFNPITHSYKIIDGWKKYYSSSQDVFFFALNETDDGNILLNGSGIGIFKYHSSSGELTLQKVSDELWNRGIGKFPATKFIDSFGVYWLGLFDSGILKYDPKRRPFKLYPFEKDGTDQSSLAITTSIASSFKNKNELYISSHNQGIFKFNLKNHKMSKLNIPLPSLYSENSNMREIVFDENDRIWFFSSDLNLSSFDIKSRKTETYPLVEQRRVLGANASLNGLQYLPKNKIVISSNVGGQIFNTETKKSDPIPSIGNRLYADNLLNRIRKMVKVGKSISSITKAGEAAELSETISITEETNVVLVCLGEGEIDGGMYDFGSILDEKNNIVWSMDSIFNTFHSGGGSKNRLQIEAMKLKPGNYKINFHTDIGHSYGAFNVMPPKDSTWYGLQLFKLDEKEFSEISSTIESEKKNKSYMPIFGSDIITTSRKYPNTLWIGTATEGLFKYDIYSGKFRQYANEKLNSTVATHSLIFEDRKGMLWIVYDPSGFYRFDPEKEEFISNASIPELPLTAINSIVEDFSGNMWISSSGGITKLIGSSEKEVWSTTQFDSKDGVSGGFGGGAFVTQEGEILTGTFNGVTAFYPSSENNTPPIPIITDASISDISIFDEKSELEMENSIFETKELNLTFDQNDISFEFASIHYSRPSKNRISYKLEGFNEHWVHTDRNFASFTNLEPGEYIFKVRAISGYGIISEYDRSLKINVSPPIYRTTFAYIFYGLFFVGVVFGIDRIQRRRLLHKAKERMKIQDAEHRAEAAELQSRAVQAESDRKTKELEEARQLQLSMLPKELPQLPHLDIAVYMKTATEVGGDYYDFHIGMDGTLTVVVGDATGHGMKAGTMVTTTKSLFNVLAPNPNIVETFHEMTRCLKLMHLEKLSMCMTMLKIVGNKIQMSAAGMPPVFIYKSESQSIEEHVMKGMPLGTFTDFPYSLIETTISSGDTILLMSDGFPELFNEKKEMYGYKRTRNLFEDLAEETPEEIITQLKNAGSEWVKDKDPDDDVTFVVIKVK